MTRPRPAAAIFAMALLLPGLAVPASAQGGTAQAPIPNLAGKVLTVRGPIEPAALGSTPMHEHIFIDFKAPPPMAPPPTDIHVLRPPGDSGFGLTDYAVALAEVMAFRQAGGGTIVDATNFGLTRDPDALYAISAETDVNVVMGSGWYMRTLHPPDMDQRTVQELTDILVHDITVGAQGTSVRSGIIGEVGTGVFGKQIPLTANELKSVRASARASRLTGAPITIHSFAAPDELQRVLDIIASEGVDLHHVVMGHTGTGDVAAMRRYTDRGAYIEFDFMGQAPGTMGSRGSLAVAAGRIAANIKALIDAGLTGHILVSHDVCIPGQLTKNGGGGFTYIPNQVVPALKSLGVSDDTIQQILVDNPRRLLTFVAPEPLLVAGGH